MLCDTYAANIVSVSVLNSGFWTATAPYAGGICFYDAFETTIHNFTIRGYYTAFRTVNGGGNITMGTVDLGTLDGQSTPTVAFRLDDGGTGRIHVETLRWESQDGYIVVTGSTWNDVGGKSLTIGRLCCGVAREYQNLTLYRAKTGDSFADGEIGEIYDNTVSGVHYRGIQVPTGTSPYDKAVSFGVCLSTTHWMLASSGPRRGVLMDPTIAVAPGDNIVPVGGQKIGGVDGTKTVQALGCALEYRAATTGIVQIG
jgi:hypothetical protein